MEKSKWVSSFQFLKSGFPEEIRPDQALAALRIGFLMRRVEHELVTIWTESLLMTADVEETFRILATKPE